MKTSLVLAVAFVLPLCSFSSASEKQEKINVEEYRNLINDALKARTYEGKKENNWDARITYVYGDVKVKPEGSEYYYKAVKDMPLSSKDTIKTGTESGATISFDDKGILRVESNTEARVDSIDKGNSLVNLLRGSIVSKITHLLGGKFKWKVRTPAAVCAVRGTEFAVEHNAFSNDSSFAVFDEGKIEVQDIPSEEGMEVRKILLEKNSEVSIGPKIKRLKKRRLFRMARHKARLLKLRKRLKFLKKTWKPLSLAKRRALRKKLLKRNIIRKKIKNKRQKLKNQLRQKPRLRRRPPPERPRRRRR